LRAAQLAESAANLAWCPRVLERGCEHVHNGGITPEVGEMFERQVDRAGDGAAPAKVAKFGELSLSKRHAVIVGRRADASLHSG
jgi:hypothetical protein